MGVCVCHSACVWIVCGWAVDIEAAMVATASHVRPMDLVDEADDFLGLFNDLPDSTIGGTLGAEKICPICEVSSAEADDFDPNITMAWSGTLDSCCKFIYMVNHMEVKFKERLSPCLRCNRGGSIRQATRQESTPG
jgi:hypothetical protein